MQMTPYLNFNGQCDTAFKFYEKCFGGKIALRVTMGETPMAKDMPKENHNQIAHVRLEAGHAVLMGSDACEKVEKPQGFSVNINLDTAEEAEKVFKGLSENGTIKMPISETFWAVRFGFLVDQFGIPWMINCDKKR
jgi:PhnB protein